MGTSSSLRTDGLYPAEEVVGTAPLTVRRRIAWADCDPAGVVHTGRFPDFVLSAATLFRTFLFGAAWHDRYRADGVGSPAKALSLIFQSSLWPGDSIDIAVFVGSVRTRTVDLMLQALRTDDRCPVFLARLTSICVAAEDRRVSTPLPEAYRRAFVDYAGRHPVPAELAEIER